MHMFIYNKAFLYRRIKMSPYDYIQSLSVHILCSVFLIQYGLKSIPHVDVDRCLMLFLSLSPLVTVCVKAAH